MCPALTPGFLPASSVLTSSTVEKERLLPMDDPQHWTPRAVGKLDRLLPVPEPADQDDGLVGAVDELAAVQLDGPRAS